jgi:D-alanyl-D-alanine carboxypeptidase
MLHAVAAPNQMLAQQSVDPRLVRGGSSAPHGLFEHPPRIGEPTVAEVRAQGNLVEAHTRQVGVGKRLVTVAALATAAIVGGVLVLDSPDSPGSPGSPGSPSAADGTDPVRAVGVPQSSGGSSSPGAPAAPSTSQKPFDKTAHSTTDPSSIWVIVNKTHPISPSDFRPDIAIVRGYQVATAAAGPLTSLLDASDEHGLGIKIESAFRSYAYQVNVHAATAAAQGDAAADRISARAGYSEHQTGLAVDLITPDDSSCDFEPCFARTPAGSWLAENAWRFGFIVRYQPATTAVTGYSPEPWHLRFVGTALSQELHTEGVATLEEFFGVSGGDYPH